MITKRVLALVLALMMVPGVLTLVPSYILYKTLGLHDNLMAVSYTHLTLPTILLV